MNWIAFVLFFIALILLIASIHLGWVIWLVVIGGLVLSALAGPAITLPWRRA